MLARIVSALVMAGAFVVASAERANAALIVWICNDIACSAGGDFMIADGSGDDNNPNAGWIEASEHLGTVSVSGQSYPAAGTPGAPLLALTYELNADGFANLGGTPFFYATQNGFTAVGTATMQADASAGSGTVRIFTGANLPVFAPPGGVPILTCMLDCGGTAPTFAIQPYQLTIGVAPTQGAGGTARGDVTVTVAVPDGGTTATLLGSVLVAIGLLRRRLGNG